MYCSFTVYDGPFRCAVSWAQKLKTIKLESYNVKRFHHTKNIKAQVLPIDKAQAGKTYCAYQKHANSEVQKQQTHTKRIEIHQSQVTNHELLNPLKQTSVF